MNVNILILAAALLAPLLTYLGVVRRLSGKVKTSDAAQLWEESRSIREALQKRNEFLQTVIDRCTERIERLEKTVANIERRNEELHRENSALQRLVDAHEETIRGQKDQIKALRERVSELEAINGRT